jgi:hypothetical protein
MNTTASVLALAMLATAFERVASAAETYETIVIAPSTRETSVANLPAEELRQAPGAQGDAGKALENLPGVARPVLGGGELVVWGATPEETRVVVDGIEIPALYHLGGLRSTVHTGFVRSLVLVPGGYGAEFGRGLGGLVRIDSRVPPTERYAGEVDADVLDASFEAGAAVGNGVGVMAAGRIGYLDRVLAGALSSDTRRLFPLPRYDDFQGKVSFALRDDERAEVIFLTSSDSSAIAANGSAGPSSLASQQQDRSFTRLGLRYARALPDGSGGSLTPFAGWDHTRREQTAELALASEAIDSTVVGLRADYVAPFSPWSILTLGFDGMLTWSSVQRSGSATLPAREGDIVAFGQPISGGASDDAWNTAIGNLAPYAALELVRGRWRFLPSFRFDGYSISTNRSTPPTGVTPQVGTSHLSWSPAPRLAVAHETRSWLHENFALGLYHQAPEPGDLSAVFGSPNLGVEHALHAVAGWNVDLGSKLTLQPTFFYRRMWGLVMRNPDPSPPLAQALVQDGQGRAYGAQILLHFTPHPVFSGWLAYTLSRSERQHEGDASYRLLDQDQTHLLTAVGNATLRGFVFGLRFRLATGMPRTPVIGSYLDTTTGQYQPLFGQQNGIRLPVFYALDARLEKRFRRRSVDIVPYLEVLNLTNHANVEEFAYDEQFASRSNITGLPILAVAGLSVRF